MPHLFGLLLLVVLKSSSSTVDLPFAGEYEVTFGVETPGGIVYGDPYKIGFVQE